MKRLLYLFWVSFGVLVSCQTSPEETIELSSSNELSSVEFVSSFSETSSSTLTGSSSMILDISQMEVLLSQFPRRQMNPEELFQLTWRTEGLEGLDYQVFIYTEDRLGTRRVIDSIQNQDSLWLDLSDRSNGDRVKLRLELKGDGFELSDETAFFDIHNGITPLTYSGEIKNFFNKYCTSCHGSTGGLRLETYEQVSEGNVPLYVMNRVNFIGDMPPSEELQPSDSEKEALRDWVLGGYPE